MIVGVLGGGQLGRMLALAGLPLGLRFRFLDPDPDCTAAEVGELVVGGYDDEGALARLVRGVEAVTYEFENVPALTAAWLAAHAPVHPPARALAVAQDRVLEKELFWSLGIETPVYEGVDTRGQLDAAIERVGFPAVLKTRRFGYDGKGQVVIREPREAEAAWRALGWRRSDRADLVLEAFVQFAREVSVIGVRGRDGRTAFYPPVENEHVGGMLAKSVAPAPGVDAAARGRYEAAHTLVMEALGYVGVLGIEFFELADGSFLANEMAPRVHNSGHWTIEGAVTSQFENHLRAVLGLPLGDCAMSAAVIMLNIIGAEPDLSGLLALPGVHAHLYGKSARPGRKLGHVTITGADAEQVARAAAACLRDG